MILSIPSPPISGWQIGPFYLHIYALCLITGIIAAWMIGNRRWQARGGTSEHFETILLVAIPVGILGARLYHVLTHVGDYFGPGRDPWSSLRIWEGGIAIYGAIGFGALAAWLMCRRQGVRFSSLADALAPGIAVGQALGRFGNWFNQELYGLPTTLPWGLEIDPAHRVPGYQAYATFHPTFLYESVWNALVAVTLLWADRRWTLGRGKVFALYVALYGFGRFFTEGIRLDFSYDTFGPIRFNQAVAALICLVGVGLLIWLVKNKPGREDTVYTSQPAAAPTGYQDAAGDQAVADGSATDATGSTAGAEPPTDTPEPSTDAATGESTDHGGAPTRDAAATRTAAPQADGTTNQADDR